MSLRTTLSGWIRRPIAYVGGEWNRMAPRERRLVGGLLSAVVVFAVLVTGFLVISSLSDIEGENNDARQALDDIAKHKDEYLEAKARMMAQDARIGTEPPQLDADLEAAAHEVGIQIPTTTPRPPVPAGKRFLEHNVDITLRQVDLLSLSKFLSKLETGRRLILITRLDIRRRFTEGEMLDVELTATAYERIKDTKRKTGPAAKGTKT